MVGASANLLGSQMGVGISLIIGFIGGFISILLWKKIEWVKKYDTFGIFSLHLIPGLLSGFLSCFIALAYSKSSINYENVDLWFFHKYYKKN